MEPLDPEICYRALRTRDARFDGRFFTAVRSTGVYCRPICPARTPRREQCLFLPCAAAAQEAGYRPCLRCRPEASPGTPAWLGTSATVSRALRLIGEGALDQGDVASLAARLGVGDRHLRRLFLRHLGASPISVAQNRRILFAKRLIDETRLPMAQLALASGFSSVRRFNDAIRASYGRTPRELRSRRAAPKGPGIALKLAYRPPLDWEALCSFLAARAIPGVEAVADKVYRRSFRLSNSEGVLEVRSVAGQHHLQVNLEVTGDVELINLTERLRRLFDLGADPHEIGRHLRRDRRMLPKLKKHPGLRVPGAWDGFEVAVRAVLGQQVSVRGAGTLAGRLVERFGKPLGMRAAQDPQAQLRFVFPTPESLKHADVETIGLPRARAEAIRSLASTWNDLAMDGSQDLEASVAQLIALPGIGDWTAHYIAMRVLREPDAFPAGDLGLRRGLIPGRTLSPRELAEQAEAWRPWRAYAALHLWSAL